MHGQQGVSRLPGGKGDAAGLYTCSRAPASIRRFGALLPRRQRGGCGTDLRSGGIGGGRSCCANVRICGRIKRCRCIGSCAGGIGGGGIGLTDGAFLHNASLAGGGSRRALEVAVVQSLPTVKPALVKKVTISLRRCGGGGGAETCVWRGKRARRHSFPRNNNNNNKSHKIRTKCEFSRAHARAQQQQKSPFRVDGIFDDRGDQLDPSISVTHPLPHRKGFKGPPDPRGSSRFSTP